MKSDERHELKSNELEKLTNRLRPIFEQYGMHMVLGVAAVVAIAAALLWFNRSSSSEKTAGWSELNSAGTAEKLLEVAESEALAKKPVAAWARLQAAEQYLDTGIRQTLTNREGDRGLVSDLGEARDNFRKVLEVAPAGSELKERALYGLGKTLETMAGVNQRTDAENSMPADFLAEAAKVYEQLLKEFPDSPYNQKRYEEEELGNLERHLEYVKSEEAKEFYAWLRTQNPRESDRRGPFDTGLPPGHPGLDSGPVRLPQIPDSLRLPDDEAADRDDAGPSLLPGTPETPAESNNAPADGTDAVKAPDPAPAGEAADKEQP